MHLTVIAAWFIFIYPSNTNQEIKLPTPYEKERWCQTEVIDEITSYVAKNGGDLKKTRAVCREEK